jgi:hypothetical protein
MLYMRDNIKANKIVFKAGSYDWDIFFGIPVSFFILAIIVLGIGISTIPSIEIIYFFIASVFLILLGVISYRFQLNKLSFKKIPVKGDPDLLKKEVKQMLLNNRWDIDFDNKIFLQATYRGFLNKDMITLKFEKDLIKWNVIYHPDTHNSFACLFSINLHGKKIISLIEAYVNDLPAPT